MVENPPALFPRLFKYVKVLWGHSWDMISSILLTLYSLFTLFASQELQKRVLLAVHIDPNQRIAVWLAALSMFLFYAGFRAWSEEATHTFSADKIRALRQGLAIFILEGQTIRGRCFKGEEYDSLERDALDWISRLDAFLSDQFDDSYVIRSQNSSGLPMGTFTSSLRPDPREVRLYGAIGTRLARLEEFSKELR
jgi:hypothetical protein